MAISWPKSCGGGGSTDSTDRPFEVGRIDLEMRGMLWGCFAKGDFGWWVFWIGGWLGGGFASKSRKNSLRKKPFPMKWLVAFVRKTYCFFFWVGCFWVFFFCFFLIWGDNTKREGWSLIVWLFNHSFWTCAIIIMKGTAFFLISSGPNDRTTAFFGEDRVYLPTSSRKWTAGLEGYAQAYPWQAGEGVPKTTERKDTGRNLWVFCNGFGVF